MDYYDVLGASRASGPAEIKSAFRRAIRQWHPDMFQSYKDKVRATEKTRQLLDAVRILLDPASRTRYDASLPRSMQAQAPMPANPAESTGPQTRPFYQSPFFEDDRDFSRWSFAWNTAKAAFWLPVLAVLGVSGVVEILRGGLSKVDVTAGVRAAMVGLVLYFLVGTLIAWQDLKYRIRFIIETLRIRRDYGTVIRDLRLSD